MSAIHIGGFSNPFRSQTKKDAPPAEPPKTYQPPPATPLRSPVEDANYWAYHADFDNTTLVINRAQPYERVRFDHKNQTARAESPTGAKLPGMYAYDESVMTLANAATTKEEQPFVNRAGGTGMR